MVTILGNFLFVGVLWCIFSQVSPCFSVFLWCIWYYVHPLIVPWSGLALSSFFTPFSLYTLITVLIVTYIRGMSFARSRTYTVVLWIVVYTSSFVWYLNLMDLWVGCEYFLVFQDLYVVCWMLLLWLNLFFVLVFREVVLFIFSLFVLVLVHESLGLGVFLVFCLYTFCRVWEFSGSILTFHSLILKIQKYLHYCMSMCIFHFALK